jgi:VanZ family protein
MIRTRLIYALLGTATFLIIAQSVATALYDVRPVEWYYTPSHVLGGMFVMFTALYFADGFRVRPHLYTLLIIAFLIGVAWEILEYGLQLYSPLWDSTSDLIADTAGAYIGWFIKRRLLHT